MKAQNRTPFNLLLKMCIRACAYCLCVYAYMVTHGFDTVNRCASENSSGCVVQDSDLISLMLISKGLKSATFTARGKNKTKPKKLNKNKVAAVNTLASNGGWPHDNFTLDKLLQDKTALTRMHVTERVLTFKNMQLQN